MCALLYFMNWSQAWHVGDIVVVTTCYKCANARLAETKIANARLANNQACKHQACKHQTCKPQAFKHQACKHQACKRQACIHRQERCRRAHVRLLPLILSSVKSLELSRAAGKGPVSMLYCRSSLCKDTTARCVNRLMYLGVHGV